ncbi:MAG: AraC family transcriptional regulator [Pseudomonadales bacterium]|nr:AraC family transcriptional regulator [Pseudomonadales bacterium]
MDAYVLCQPGGIFIYQAQVLQAIQHAHSALQLVIPTGELSLQISDDTFTTPCLIASDVEHCLTMAGGWVILIEPQSSLGNALAGLLQGSKVVRMTWGSVANVKPPEPERVAEYGVLAWSSFFEGLGIANTAFSHLLNVDGKSLDPRIAKIISFMNRCFSEDCVKPQHWRAAMVAGQVNLSEGRFLHLFRQQMGIAWRPYLLWRRLLCAVVLLQKIGNATEAAHATGFSDSAHLSRTFKSKFGLTIRQAALLFKVSS